MTSQHNCIILLNVFPILFVRQQKHQIDSMNKIRDIGSQNRHEEGDSFFSFIDKNQNIQTQMEVLVKTFKQYSEQNKKLTGLYELTKRRNQELNRISIKFSGDLSFLKDYCLKLEQELASLGYYKHQHADMLSRKQTADSIFLTYNQSTLSLIHDYDIEDSHLEHQNRILNLQTENRLLKQQLQTQIHKALNKSVQVNCHQNQIQDYWCRAYKASEEKVIHLQKQVREVRRLNDALEYDRQKRGITTFIMKDRSQLFDNIHSLINEYKKKINDLAHQKKQVEKKYKQLKQKVSKHDEKNQYKLIQLYSQKIEVLQKLTEKQQIEIQNTILLYERELIKIEDKRREEIQSFQNERLDLQTQNLKLCIDLQKSLNNKDEVALQLMQEKNKNQILLQEIKLLKLAIDTYKKRQDLRKNLAVCTNTVEIFINPIPFRSSHKTNLISPASSFIAGSNSQRSQTDNIQYQFFQASEKKQLIEKIEEVTLQRQNSLSKKSIREKVKITYGNPPYMIKPHYGVNLLNKGKNFITPTTIPSSPSSNLNKSYDSVIQYKRRFIQRKPESSFNH